MELAWPGRLTPRRHGHLLCPTQPSPVGAAGKATGRAFKRAFTWTWDKLRGKDSRPPRAPHPTREDD